MTIIPWYKTVRGKGTLLVFPKSTFTSGRWSNALDEAMKILNQKLSEHELTLEFKKADKEIDAHIVLEAEQGNGIHGNADLSTMKMRGALYLDKITVRVPATPRIDPKNDKAREVGHAVRVYILVHELIHAVGLTNDEHSKDDVFTKGAVLMVGATAAEDKIQPYDGGATMPPIRIGATTLNNLMTAWKDPVEKKPDPAKP
jgi:hypothetical protein